MPSYVPVGLPPEAARGKQVPSCPCATFRRCDLVWTELWDCCERVWRQGQTLVPKPMCDRRHGNSISIITSLLAAKPLHSWEGKGTKPTQTLTWKLAFPGINPAFGDAAVWGGTASPADGDSWPWSRHKQGWTKILDLSLQGACGKAAEPGPMPAQREFIDTDHPKILLRHF